MILSVQGKDRIAMSQRERDRLRILHELQKGQLRQVKAAELLRLSVRQVRRLQERLAERGDASLVHGLRGRASNRSCDAVLRKRVLSAYRKKYADFGPTFASEKLADTLRESAVSIGQADPSGRARGQGDRGIATGRVDGDPFRRPIPELPRDRMAADEVGKAAWGIDWGIERKGHRFRECRRGRRGRRGREEEGPSFG